jgi:hypothetical protein
MSKPRNTLTGRPVIDDQGNSTWQWGGEGGSDVQSEKVRELADGLSLEQPDEPANPDPYNKALSQGRGKPNRRSLDDMRRLDDQMKKEHDELVKRLRTQTSRK